jgi:hypothetical protein
MSKDCAYGSGCNPHDGSIMVFVLKHRDKTQLTELQYNLYIATELNLLH